MCFFFFFFNDTATTEIYTLSLHDALPILVDDRGAEPDHLAPALRAVGDHGPLLAVLAGGLREAPAVAGEGLALRGRAEHTQVLREVGGPDGQRVDARRRGDLVEPVEGSLGLEHGRDVHARV